MMNESIKPCHTSPRGTAWYRAAPREAAFSIHTNDCVAGGRLCRLANCSGWPTVAAGRLWHRLAPCGAAHGERTVNLPLTYSNSGFNRTYAKDAKIDPLVMLGKKGKCDLASKLRHARIASGKWDGLRTFHPGDE
uniref:Uncharacterized protein n=1 Tax=Romanomermis culicivorax TaxID=13658 RepID=A0A915JRE1_ROMCU